MLQLPGPSTAQTRVASEKAAMISLEYCLRELCCCRRMDGTADQMATSKPLLQELDLKSSCQALSEPEPEVT